MPIKDKIEGLVDKVTHKNTPHQTGSTTGNYATGTGGNTTGTSGGQDYSLSHTGTSTKAASDYRHHVQDSTSGVPYEQPAAGGGLAAGSAQGTQSYDSSTGGGVSRGSTGTGIGTGAGGLGAGGIGAGGRTEQFDTEQTYGTSGATGGTTGSYGTSGVTGGDSTYGTSTGVTGGATTGGHAGVIDEREIIDSKTFTKTLDHEVLVEKKRYELEHRPVQEQYVVETRKIGETALPIRAEVVGTEVREVEEKLVAAPRGERTVIVQDVDVPLEEVREVTRGVANVGLSDNSYTTGGTTGSTGRTSY